MMNCDLDSECLQALIDFKCLERLNIANNVICDIPDDLGNLKNTLEDLDVAACELNMNGFKSICKCSRLKNLWFAGNSLEEISNELDLENLKNTLLALNVSECNAKPEFLAKLSSLNKLQKLWLSYNSLLNNIPIEFGNMKRTLAYLEIDNSGITRGFLENIISQCSKLMTIDLGTCENASSLISELQSNSSINLIHDSYIRNNNRIISKIN